MKVTFFQRKPRKGFSFSLEFIFSDLRSRLKNKIEADVKISTFYNDGYLSKICNILEASLRQSKSINHITGEIHFLNFLMRKNTVILTILDCGMMNRKKGIAKFIVRWLYLTLPLKSSKFVTTISEVTKQEIIKYTNCNPNKITVVPVGVDSIYRPYPRIFEASKPNILHIGTGYNKNLFRLIEALKGIDCRLTVIGKLSQDQIDALNNNTVNYSNAYNISQKEMLEKYKECDILAFISTFEGFGMPIIEANSVERVVITSNISSMPEVAQNAAHLVNPLDIDEIRTGIIKLINDKKYREQLINNGRKNKLRFDSNKIANSYFELYCKIKNQN